MRSLTGGVKDVRSLARNYDCEARWRRADGNGTISKQAGATGWTAEDSRL